MGQGDQLGGLGDVLVDGVVAAIEHDGGEAGGNAGLGTLISAVIQMQGNGNGDAQALVHGLDHAATVLKPVIYLPAPSETPRMTGEFISCAVSRMLLVHSRLLMLN